MQNQKNSPRRSKNQSRRTPSKKTTQQPNAKKSPRFDFDLLKTLTETPSVSGKEERIREVIKKAMEPLVDTLDVDVMGNVIGFKKGTGTNRRKIMIAAHMDEIGFIVRHIDEKGFLRLQPLGGFDPRQLFSQRMIVHTRNGDSIRGVLSYTTKPVHIQSAADRKGTPELNNFFVDLGMGGEKVKKMVSIGDMVTMDRKMEVCGEGYVAKSMDDRVGVFTMIETLRALKKAPQVDVYAVATVQEEVGLRGAGTAGFSIAPDVSIAIDVTLANDCPGQPSDVSVTKWGKGVAIKIMDSSVICHPKLVEYFRTIAEKYEIPHQMEILPRGGTDAGAMQRSRGGNASITISIPTRYVHTVNEMVHTKDINATIALLTCYLGEAHKHNYDL